MSGIGIGIRNREKGNTGTKINIKERKKEDRE
jgi:hypothetical protein